MANFELIATATFGLESIVAREIKKLGYEDMKVENARVTFRGDESAICRSNLWLRSADRVFIKMGEFTALSFEELFERTKALPWGEFLPENASFPVEGKSVKSGLFSVPDCQAIVKKAIVEKMKQKYGKEWFDEDGPVFPIEVGLLKDVATLTIDTSGAGLHKRGYRQAASDAPLKETLAAAMVSLSFWHPDRILMDPLCGSGTIPIEAAMIGRNMAPGRKREFAAEQWPFLPEILWTRAREEAEAAIDRTREFRILASDIDGRVLKIARRNAELAGVEDLVAFQTLPVAEVRRAGGDEEVELGGDGRQPEPCQSSWAAARPDLLADGHRGHGAVRGGHQEGLGNAPVDLGHGDGVPGHLVGSQHEQRPALQMGEALEPLSDLLDRKHVSPRWDIPARPISTFVPGVPYRRPALSSHTRSVSSPICSGESASTRRSTYGSSAFCSDVTRDRIFSTVPIFLRRFWNSISTSRKNSFSSLTAKGDGLGTSSTMAESTLGEGQNRDRGTVSRMRHSAR